jgi:hypothetical protein
MRIPWPPYTQDPFEKYICLGCHAKATFVSYMPHSKSCPVEAFEKAHDFQITTEFLEVKDGR